MGEDDTKWKIRFIKQICGPDETIVNGRAGFHMMHKLSKEIQSLAPCAEEVALDIVKPLVNTYAEKVLRSRNRFHFTTKFQYGWRLIVIGMSETNGMEAHLVPERNWTVTRLWNEAAWECIRQ